MRVPVRHHAANPRLERSIRCSRVDCRSPRGIRARATARSWPQQRGRLVFRRTAYARSRCSIAPSTSPSHQRVRPKPSRACGLGILVDRGGERFAAPSQSPATVLLRRLATRSDRRDQPPREDEGSGAHRVPDRLVLHQGRDLVGALALVLEWIGLRAKWTRFTFSAESSSTSSRSSSGTPVASIGHVHVPGEPRHELLVKPVRMLITPPGTSTSRGPHPADRRERHRSLASTTAVLPLTIAGARRDTRPSSDWSCGATPHHAGRLGDREVEVRPGHGVGRPLDLVDLVRPARVPDPAVDRGAHAFAGSLAPASFSSPSNCERRPSISSATR